MSATPRLLEACRRQGIHPSELEKPEKGHFRRLLGRGTPKEIVRMHKEHYEERRREKLQLVLDERKRIEQESPRPFASSTSVPDSNLFLLSHERQKLDALRRRQEIEFQQIQQHEELQQALRLRLEAKAAHALAQQQRHQATVEANRREAEDRRLREEERKRKLEEERQEEIRLIKETHFEQEQRKLQADTEKARLIKTAARDREEEAKRRQEELQAQTERILHDQRETVEAKRREMDLRDRQRLKALGSRTKRLRARNEAKRRRKEAKLRAAKDNLAAILDSQRAQYEEKQAESEQRRLEFEHRRELLRQQTALKAAYKKEQITQILTQSERLEAQKLAEYRSRMEKAEEKQRELAEIAENERRIKAEIDQEKEQERLQVLTRNAVLEAEKKAEFLLKQREMEAQMTAFRQQQAWHKRLQREKQQLKRQDRVEEVERVRKMREYRKEQTQERMKTEDLRSARVKQARQALVDMRMQLRREIDRKKEEIRREFEAKKGGSAGSSRPKSSQNKRNSAFSSRPGALRIEDLDSISSQSTPRPEVIDIHLESPLKSMRLKASIGPYRRTESPNQLCEGDMRAGTVSTRTGGTGRAPEREEERLSDAEFLKQSQKRLMLEELQVEEERETEREQLLSSTASLKAKARLEKIFGAERAQASARLQALSERFSASLARLQTVARKAGL